MPSHDDNSNPVAIDETAAGRASEASHVTADHAGHTPVHAVPRTGIWMLVAALILAIGLGSGFYIVNHRRAAAEEALRGQTEDAADAPMPVDVVKVRYSPATRLLPLPGDCRAWYESTLYARVSGYVGKWNADIGDHVKAGQVLATIETPELDQQLASNEAKLHACEAQIKLAQANVHFSEVTLARYKDAPKGIVSDLERDQKEADDEVSRARLTAAQSDLNSAQAEVDRLHAMIAFQKVVAPFDGVITQRRVDIGNLVTAGSAANTTPLFTLAQSDQIRVFVNVPESAAVEIHDGDPATATADEYHDRQFVGRVARTSRAINDTSKTLRVEVDIPNADMSLLPGMFVRVNFQIRDSAPSLIIPASAINFRSGGPQVAVVSPDDRVAFRDVTIAHDLGDAIEITHGLQPDDRVVLNISYQIAAGDLVKPTEVTLPGSPVSAPKTTSQPSDDGKRLSVKTR